MTGCRCSPLILMELETCGLAQDDRCLVPGVSIDLMYRVTLCRYPKKVSDTYAYSIAYFLAEVDGLEDRNSLYRSRTVFVPAEVRRRPISGSSPLRYQSNMFPSWRDIMARTNSFVEADFGISPAALASSRSSSRTPRKLSYIFAIRLVTLPLRLADSIDVNIRMAKSLG